MLWEKLIFFSSCSGSLLDTDTLVVRTGPPSAYHSKLENGVSWVRVGAFFLNRKRHGHANCITSLCQRVMKMFIHLAKYAKDEDRKVSFNSSGCKGFCFRDQQEEHNWTLWFQAQWITNTQSLVSGFIVSERKLRQISAKLSEQEDKEPVEMEGTWT